MGKLTYEEAGVDIHAGENAVSKIKPLVKKTFNKNVLSHIGGFGGLYNIDLEKWKKPVLVSSADGVGTKLMIAVKAGNLRYRGSGSCQSLCRRYFCSGSSSSIFS